MRTREVDLQRTFDALPRSLVVLEACGQSPWISRLLNGLGHEALVVNPHRVKVIADSFNKTDKRDARMLAGLGLLAPQLLSRVEHRSEQEQADLAVIRARDLVGRPSVRQPKRPARWRGSGAACRPDLWLRGNAWRRRGDQARGLARTLLPEGSGCGRKRHAQISIFWRNEITCCAARPWHRRNAASGSVPDTAVRDRSRIRQRNRRCRTAGDPRCRPARPGSDP